MDELIGKTLLNRYRLIKSLGHGGMAEVYKAWDKERAAHLAVKVLRQDLSRNMIFLDRFKSEAHTLEKLQHPNIVRFYGIERDDLTVFILMDFIQGATLQDNILRARGIPLNEAFIFLTMKSLCSALQYAHHEGIIHCDIKPGNIMIDASGKVMLTDFGIARKADAASSTKTWYGTPAYMAPEQVLGFEPTPQSDIYSLGVVLYEMVTGGKRPFTGESARITGTASEKVRWEKKNLVPPSPVEFNPKITPDLEAIILKCLDKDPQKRYKSILDFREAYVNQASRNGLVEDAFQDGSGIDFSADVDHKIKDKLPLHEVVHQKLNRQNIFLKNPFGKVFKKEHLLKRVIWAAAGLLSLILIIILLTTGKNGGNKDQSPEADSIVANRMKTKDTFTEEVIEVVNRPTSTNTQRQRQEETEIPSATETRIVTTEPVPSKTSTMTPTQEPSINYEINPVDDAQIVFIPSGPFLVGQNNLTENLGDYWIYRFEVTNEQFAQFIDENPTYETTAEKIGWSYAFDVSDDMLVEQTNGAYWAAPQGSGSRWDATYPVVHVSWNDAQAYCNWAGGKLPSSNEWEKAARGPDGNIYPWGSGSPSCSRANYQDCLGYITPVGSYPDGQSEYGVMDMAGNVFEWVNIRSDGSITIRGGSIFYGEEYLRTWNSTKIGPEHTTFNLGFRCVLKQIP